MTTSEKYKQAFFEKEQGFFEKEGPDGETINYQDLSGLERWGGVTGMAGAATRASTQAAGHLMDWPYYLANKGAEAYTNFARPQTLLKQFKHWWDPKSNPAVNWTYNPENKAPLPLGPRLPANWTNDQIWPEDPNAGTLKKSLTNLVRPVVSSAVNLGRTGLDFVSNYHRR
jgi:hypothetical protein